MPFEPRLRLPPGLERPRRVDPTGRTGPTRGQARSKQWRRVGPSVYVPDHPDAPPEQRILDATGLLPPTGAVTGWAALRLREAAYFDGLDGGGGQRPVPLIAGTTARRTQPGVRFSYEVLPADDVTDFHGIRVATPERALFDELRCLEDRDAIVAADMAVASGLVNLPSMTEYALQHRGFRRSGRAVDALAQARFGVRSPPESRLRLIWTRDAALPRPEVNAMVFDLGGRFIGCADLFDADAGLVVEYDGVEHLRARRRARDAARDEDCRAIGLEYTRVTALELRDVGRVVSRLRAARARSLFLPPEQRRWTLEWPDGWVPWF